MLILKGKVGKSVIVERLSHYTGTVVYGYLEDMIYNVEGMLCVLSKDVSLDVFCRDLEEDILKKEHIDTLIIYTNLNEDEIIPIKDLLEKLEKINIFRFGIITCK